MNRYRYSHRQKVSKMVKEYDTYKVQKLAAVCNRTKIVLFERLNTSLQILSQAKKARYPHVIDAYSFFKFKIYI